ARDRGIEELQSEERAVLDQKRTVAALLLDLFADFPKHPPQRVGLVERRPQRAVPTDARSLKGSRVEGYAREGRHEVARLLGRLEVAARVHAYQHGGDLEQRIRCGIEAAGLDIDDDRQKAAEPLRDQRRRRVLASGRSLARCRVLAPRRSLA